MKKLPLIIAFALSMASAAFATQADNTTVAVTGQQPGASQFISKVKLLVSDPSAVRSIQFTIAPKNGSVTRPVSGTYLPAYLDTRGFFNSATNEFTLPVWGLYAARTNNVTIRFLYNDLSSEELPVVIVTQPFSDDCDFENPVVVQPRTNTTDLSFDFVLVASSCSTNTPHILDTDGEIRWVGTAGVQILLTAAFYDNAVYITEGPRLIRIEMDGEVNVIADYTNENAVGFHHNIDIGRDGLLLDVDTVDQVEAVIWEVNPFTGAIQKRYNMAQIIGDAIRAGGENPGDPESPDAFIRKAKGDFGFNAKEDWFHNNTTTYRRSDDSILISSRENFVIALDYDTKRIKWIMGDQTKRWYVQFASLRAFALDFATDSHVNIGQHALSIAKDSNLLLFDNGQFSQGQIPKGVQRGFAEARKYSLDLEAKVATEIWSYPGDQSVFTPFCSSVYEDSPLSYVIDYAVRGGIPGGNAEILALTSTGEKVFDYSYPTGPCNDAYRTLPIHLEETAFPISNVHLANISSRAFVGSENNVAVAGFIITGPAPKSVVIRGLGPSLPANGQLMDPMLELYGSDGQLVKTNDNYKQSEGLPILQREGLTPSDDREAALAPVLAPGAYTAVLRGSGNSTGLGLIEIYDIDLRNSSKLANLSTRANVGAEDSALIGGLILRGNQVKRILFRGIGPSLADNGVEGALQDPTLEVRDRNGVIVKTNDDWQNANNVAEIQATGLQPTNAQESAILMPLVTGEYTTILRGKDGAIGTGLVEIYQVE